LLGSRTDSIHEGLFFYLAHTPDKDCLEDIRVYLTPHGQQIVDKSINVKCRKAELIWVYIDVIIYICSLNGYAHPRPLGVVVRPTWQGCVSLVQRKRFSMPSTLFNVKKRYLNIKNLRGILLPFVIINAFDDFFEHFIFLSRGRLVIALQHTVNYRNEILGCF